jgi:hypothetical protein
MSSAPWSWEDLGSALDGAVAELLNEAKCTGPPVDAVGLAREHLGLGVFLDRGQRQRGRAEGADGRGRIYVRPERRLERQQWTVAHEIGEHLRPRLLGRLGLRPDEAPGMLGELVANLFAPRLLLPTAWFAADAAAFGYDLLRLKQRYATVSHEVIAVRLLDLAAACTLTVCDHGRVTRRAGNVRPAPWTLHPAEAACQAVVHDAGAPHTNRMDGCTVQGWPIHEPGWKREILRTTWEE